MYMTIRHCKVIVIFIAAMCDFAKQLLKTVTTYVKPETTEEDLFGKLVASKLESIQDPIKRLEKEQAISNALFKR